MPSVSGRMQGGGRASPNSMIRPLHLGGLCESLGEGPRLSGRVHVWHTNNLISGISR